MGVGILDIFPNFFGLNSPPIAAAIDQSETILRYLEGFILGIWIGDNLGLPLSRINQGCRSRQSQHQLG
jgi:hypothetical protein